MMHIEIRAHGKGWCQACGEERECVWLGLGKTTPILACATCIGKAAKEAWKMTEMGVTRTEVKLFPKAASGPMGWVSPSASNIPAAESPLGEPDQGRIEGE